MTFDDLVSASFDRPLTEAERAELNRKIVDEPGCAERFAYLSRVHADLRNFHVLKDVAAPTKRRRGAIPKRSVAIPWGWAAAAAGAIVFAFALSQAGTTPEKPPVRSSAAVPKPRPEPAPVVPPEPPKEVPKTEPLPPPPPPKPEPKPEPKVESPPPPPEPRPEPVAPPPPPPPTIPAPPPAPMTTVAIAHLAKPTGTVMRIGADGSVRVTEGMELYDGQSVDAAAGSSVGIVFRDKTRIDLDASTRVDNIQARDAKKATIKSGAIAAEVTAQPAGKPMVFATAQAEAEILGTTLRIVAEPKSTRLEVTEGKVRFTRLDKKKVEVAGGFYAVAGPGIDLKSLPLPKTVSLMSLAFEDGKTSPNWTGQVVPGPVRAGSRGALEGQYHPQDRLTRIRFAEPNGLLTYKKGADLSFDYWADGETSILSIYFWNRTQSVSMGGYEIRNVTKKQWTRVTVALSDLRDGIKTLQDGDLVANLTIQTNVGTGSLFIDNVEVTAPRR